MDIASQPISHDVLMDLYAQPGERSIDDVRRRIARALAQAEVPARRAAWEARFLAVQQAGFIPAGRIAAHAGTGLRATLINCFVQPLADSISHAEGPWPSIYTALAETAETLRLGGGVGLDFSPIRPIGAQVASTQLQAAGPLAFMRLFDASCQALDSSTPRRSALMAVLRWDHPDVESFVSAKAGGGLEHFNLSVAVGDAFMHAIEAGSEIELVHAAEPGPAQQAAGAARRADGRWTYRRLGARSLWDQIVRSAHGHGEPGLLFLDRINADNNLAYCETITATNPCGEQPLPPYGACCLGSIDLTRLVTQPFEPAAGFDFARLHAIVPVAVRMLDNVLEISAWPLPQQQAQAQAKRRIGLGYTGLGDALAMLGLHYDSEAARAMATRITRVLRDTAYAASTALARERGAFPLFDAQGLLREGSCASRLPPALRQRILACGLRNSHLLSIAPAGSVSLAFADNASSGIEPAYAWHYLRDRRCHRGPGVTAYDVEDHAWRLFHRLKGDQAPLPAAFVHALELSARAHLEMVAAVAPYIDGAISKTVNAPESCPLGEFASLYRQAWLLGLKGITAFRPNRVFGAVLHARAAQATPAPARRRGAN
ncbi:MAG: adenosylcobalamin-dependent ribonucleoside-diphosphate reductase [Rubrivivax sp.]|nr:adenosylcobalamin-dependent ribonucleoside-diphosphate reductase [Rubrivivax sp.]